MEAEEAAPAPRTRSARRYRRRETPLRPRRGEHEPSNAELLDFMRSMQASADHKFQDIAERLSRGEKRQDQLELAVGKRMDGVEAHLSNLNRQCAAQKKDIDHRLDIQQKQFEEVLKTVNRHTEDIRDNARATEAATAAASRTSAAASSQAGPQRSGQPYETDIVVIAGFKRDSPKGALMSAWQQCSDAMTPFMTLDMEISAPFILGAVLHVRCHGGSSSARSLVAAFRQRSLSR